MEGIKRPIFWAVIVLGILALVFHLVGFVAPGWIVVNVKPQPIDFELRPQSLGLEDKDQPQDKPLPHPEQGHRPGHWPHNRPHHGSGRHHGQHPPPHHGGRGSWSEGTDSDNGHMEPSWDDMDQDDMAEHGRARRHASAWKKESDSSEGDDEMQHMMDDFKDDTWPMSNQKMPDNDEMVDNMKENMGMDSKEAEEAFENMGSGMMSGLSSLFSKQHCAETMKNIASAPFGSRISMRFGLWFSNLCVKTGGDDDDSSGDSDEWMQDDDDGKRRHKKCHCTKMASDCFFETYDMFGPSSFVEVQSYPTADRKDLGKRLTEHRVEGTLSVVMCLAGLILGAVAFKNGYGKKWIAVTAMCAMLISCILISMPVYRHARHSCRMRSRSNDLFSIRPPFAAICSAMGGLLCFIIMIVMAAGLFCKKRTEGKWNRFSNGLYEETTQVKKPGLVFLAEPLPEKPPVYDVSDFSDLKPSEEYEPEKKPIE